MADSVYSVLKSRDSGPNPYQGISLIGNGSLTYSVSSNPKLDSKRMTLTYRIATPALDREREIVLPSGVNCEHHKKNPIVLFDHQHHLPVGLAQDPSGNYTTVVAGDCLESTVWLSQKSKISEEVYYLAENGLLNGASIGFTVQPGGERIATDESGNKIVVVERCNMHEWSTVWIPMNPDALKLGCEIVRKGFGRKRLSANLLRLYSPYMVKSPEWSNGFSIKKAEFREEDHPRDHGKWATKPGAGAKEDDEEDTESDEDHDDENDEDEEEEFVWDGTIDKDNIVRRSVERGDLIRSWNFNDDEGNALEQNVYLETARYDPNPNGDSEIQTIYRWVSEDDVSNEITDKGEWTSDEDEATRDGNRHARNSHEEPNDTEDEDDIVLGSVSRGKNDGYGPDIGIDSIPERKIRDVKPTTPKSKAQVFFTDKVDDKEAETIAKKLFDGSEDFTEDLASSVGAPDNAEIHIVHAGQYETLFTDDSPMNAVGVRVKIVHPKLATCYRFVGVDSEGRRFIKNEIIELKDPSADAGLGLEIFGRQVDHASAEGFDYIQTHAAKGPGMNGYYTWPRYGYNQSLNDPSIKGKHAKIIKEAKQLFPGAKTVLDIFKTREGRDWWGGEIQPDGGRTPGNGTDLYNAQFDLDPDSESMEILKEYREERKRRKQKSLKRKLRLNIWPPVRRK